MENVVLQKGQGTQYRFQYFVRDERGDYKTQEEAGEGGNARGSYAVEEPDGDLRIVQYTADLGGGFKAHIKVDHAGKSPSKLEEIDIPAEEMRKLITENRKKIVPEGPEVQKSSKSYALGPPRKMSDIVMEQAAAIREIISKEIEAEEKREAEEKLRIKETPADGDQGVDVVDCNEKESGNVEGEAEDKSVERTAKARKIDAEVTNDSDDRESSQISKANGVEGRRNTLAKRTGSLNGDEQSPVVRVGLNPKTGEGMLKGKTYPREYAGRDSNVESPDPALVGPLLGGPVRNFSFKNRIMFYKPAERKTGADSQQEAILDSEIPMESTDVQPGEDHEQIVIYSPYDDGESHAGRRGRYIKVPFEVLRPYLASAESEGEEAEQESERRK